MKKTRSEKKNNNGKGKKTSKRGIPAAYSVSARTGVPSVSQRPNGCVISHREMMFGVTGSVATTISTVSINPGLLLSFPWLSNVARNYETYRFKKLSFHYEPMVGTSQNGLVIMAVDFDASDPAPTTEMSLLAYAGAVSSPIYESLRLDCPPSRMKALSGELFNRVGVLPANQDIKTYDVGNLHVGLLGCADIARKGSVFVDYVIELITPGVPSPNEEYMDSAKIVSGGAGISKIEPFGATPVVTQGEDLPLSYVQGGSVIFREPGEYMLRMNVVGTGLAAGAPTLGGTVAEATSTPGVVDAAASSKIETIFVRVTQALQELIVNYNLVATTVSAVGVYLAPYKYSMR